MWDRFHAPPGDICRSRELCGAFALALAHGLRGRVGCARCDWRIGNSEHIGSVEIAMRTARIVGIGHDWGIWSGIPRLRGR